MCDLLTPQQCHITKKGRIDTDGNTVITDDAQVTTVSLAWMNASMRLLAVCRCNEKADIFSYGIVLWEIITQETPQRGTLRDIHVCIFSIVFCSSLFIFFVFWSLCWRIFIAAGVHCGDVVLMTKRGEM